MSMPPADLKRSLQGLERLTVSDIRYLPPSSRFPHLLTSPHK
jgi:hypothetical protein